jgi:hypothetical protein
MKRQQRPEGKLGVDDCFRYDQVIKVFKKKGRRGKRGKKRSGSKRAEKRSKTARLRFIPTK